MSLNALSHSLSRCSSSLSTRCSSLTCLPSSSATATALSNGTRACSTATARRAAYGGGRLSEAYDGFRTTGGGSGVPAAAGVPLPPSHLHSHYYLPPSLMMAAAPSSSAATAFVAMPHSPAWHFSTSAGAGSAGESGSSSGSSSSGESSSTFLPPGGRAARLLRSTAMWTVVGIGVGVAAYYGAQRATRRVPREVAAHCARGAELEAQGVPLSAAQAYERAEKYLLATGGEPVVLVEVLLRLGDAQLDGRATAKAVDTFRRAVALCTAMESNLGDTALAVNEVARKHALALDRMASAEEAGGQVAAALTASGDAVEYARRHFADTLTAAAAANAPDAAAAAARAADDVGRSPAAVATVAAARLTSAAPPTSRFDKRARFLLADLAGVFFNRAHLVLTHLPAVAGDTVLHGFVAAAVGRAEADAAEALFLVAVAHTSALRVAVTLLTSAGEGSASRAVHGAIDARQACRATPGATPVTRAASFAACLTRADEAHPTAAAIARLASKCGPEGVALAEELAVLVSLEGAARGLFAESRRLVEAYTADGWTVPADVTATVANGDRRCRRCRRCCLPPAAAAALSPLLTPDSCIIDHVGGGCGA